MVLVSLLVDIFDQPISIDIAAIYGLAAGATNG